MKFSIKDFFNKCDKIRSYLRIWSHLQKNSLMQKLHFFAITEGFWKKLMTNVILINKFFVLVISC